MPTVAILVCWKRNRNHRGRDIAFSIPKARDIVKEKQDLGFKTWSRNLAPDDPLVVHHQRYGSIPQP